MKYSYSWQLAVVKLFRGGLVMARMISKFICVSGSLVEFVDCMYDDVQSWPKTWLSSNHQEHASAHHGT